VLLRSERRHARTTSEHHLARRRESHQVIAIPRRRKQGESFDCCVVRREVEWARWLGHLAARGDVA
jgi:hypothetical protein